MKHRKPAALIILDGLGYTKETTCNAVAQAYMPTFSMLLNTYPTTLLEAAGSAVGLPAGTPGNSEVGHLTLGSGKIIQQPLTIINNAIQDGNFFKDPTLIQALEALKKKKKNLHIMGLLSDGNVHSSIKHLYAFLQVAETVGLEKIYIHGFLDGRDTPPQTAQAYLKQLEDFCKNYKNIVIASLQGRFYAMDRNNNWQLTQESYTTLTTKKEPSQLQEALQENYQKTGSEEFLPPLQLPGFEPIEQGDGVIFFNFRPDRARQLTSLFLSKDTSSNKNPLNLSFFITLFSYGPQYKTTTLFKKQYPEKTLNDILHDTLNYSIFSIAETEKYAHVTYFFNGGKEKKRDNETRVLIPSITRKKYSQHPEMCAPLITQAVLDSLQHDPCDFYVINYANADMVAHTGDFKATIAALECIDSQLTKLVEAFVTQHDGMIFITADHGNAEELCNPITHQVQTSHTNNPVYFTVAAQTLHHKKIELTVHKLSDVAPFILTTLEKNNN